MVRRLVQSLARHVRPWLERLRTRSRPAADRLRARSRPVTDRLRRHVLTPLTTRLVPWLRGHPAPRWLRRRVLGPARTRLGSWYRSWLTPRLRRGRAALRQRWAATTPAQRRTLRLTALSAVTGLAVALTAIAVTGPWDGGQRRAEQARVAEDRAPRPSGQHRGGDPAEPVPSAAPVLTALGGRSADPPRAGVGQVPAPSRAGLRKALGTLLDDPALGRVRAAAVVDATTGRPLYGERTTTPVVPASTIKLATATAALAALGPDHRLLTRVRATGDQVVLVGGGDPTLTENQLGRLADATAERLREDEERAGRTVTVRYDDRLFAGPARHPIGVNDNLALVSALSVNAGRTDDSTHGPAPRTPDPAASAAQTFVDLLRKRGIKVSGEPTEVRPADAAKAARQEPLATHRSAPLSLLVERMLTHSDNDLAEALARQVALAEGKPASFSGASAAVRARLAELGVPLTGSKFRDGSGLDRADRVTAGLLTELLALAADPGRPELRPVLTGLPVAGFNGTLASRYTEDGARAGAGVVHAKTGTLSGVNTLAGTVVDADGRLLAFAFLASGTTDGPAAQSALDRLAVALAGCGCR